MSVGESSEHLFYLENREGLAVEQMLQMLPQICPAWYDSLGLDADCHWALVRPILSTPTPRKPKAKTEIDVILGRIASLVDFGGAMTAIWPPPTDYLVAIEAKCPKKSWDDMAPWASPVSRKSELMQQLKRNIDLGFSRVGALHVFATSPDAESFGGAMHTASSIGDHFLTEAEREADEDVVSLPIGHCVLSVGEVPWRPYHQSGAVRLLKMRTAPLIGLAAPAIRDQVDSILRRTPRPRCWRAVYVQDSGDSWGQLDDLFAVPCPAA